ncbi:shikimate dehydrogenase family protein [Jannaschia pohangensis]|uniref:shikimate dehydrogenase (NADP(+)) n=1 Tax=Jannaschia pohangensis TaxID=390807 RepID=A0A1I3SI73_9RHOB|nr:shikimate dehydrogenase [Jannaschia pohangensis]SFJ58110.1 shikimate dehydrogenase [Jannaschia pohangensis]
MTHLVCGLIGDNIANSRLSRALAIMCADHGWTFDFTPIDTSDVPDFDFPQTVDRLRAEGWTGVTVTHPWKTQAADWAGDAMLADVRDLGASNTLTFAPLAGHNTDYTGFLAAYRNVMRTPPGRVALAGAGGVARAIVPALLTLGATDVAIWDKDADRAATLARRTGARAIPAGEAPAAIRAADGLINCTPMGMAPYGGTAFDAALIDGQAWAFDAVYTPTDTPFLLAAKSAGLALLTGFDLFRFMAMESFAAYTGVTPDAARTLPQLDLLRPE